MDVLRANMTSAEFWKWWGATSPPDNRVKDYIQHLPAPPAKRGGSKSGKKRKKPPKFYRNPFLC